MRWESLPSIHNLYFFWLSIKLWNSLRQRAEISAHVTPGKVSRIFSKACLLIICLEKITFWHLNSSFLYCQLKFYLGKKKSLDCGDFFFTESSQLVSWLSSFQDVLMCWMLLFSKNMLKQDTSDQFNACDFGRACMSPTFCSARICSEKPQNASWPYVFGYPCHSSKNIEQDF